MDLRSILLVVGVGLAGWVLLLRVIEERGGYMVQLRYVGRGGGVTKPG